MCARACFPRTSWGRRSCGSRRRTCMTSGSWRRSGRSQQLAELLGERVRLRRELAPGDAFAVALERLSCGVDGVAVDLEDDPLVRPEGAGELRAAGLAHLRPQQVVPRPEVHEPGLEVPREPRVVRSALDLQGAAEGL